MNALQITVPSTLREWLAKSSFDARTRERCWKKLARQLRHTHLSLEHCFRILQERAKKEKNPTHLIYGRIVQSLLNDREGALTLYNAGRGHAHRQRPDRGRGNAF